MIDYEAAAGTAPSTGNLPFLEGDHDHKLLVVNAYNYMGRNGNKYIIKVRVLETASTGKIPSPAVGADRSVVINLDRPKGWKPGDVDYGVQNLINFAAGLNGGAIEGATPQEKGAKLNRLLGQRAIDAAEAQALRLPGPQAAVPAFCIGMVVGDRSVESATKGSQNNPSHPITYHNWYSIKQEPKDVLARKEALKNNQPIQWPPPAPAAT